MNSPFIGKYLLLLLLPAGPMALPAQQDMKILTNQVGYETLKSKRAVIVAPGPVPVADIELVNLGTGKPVFHTAAVYSGPVQRWKKGVFYTIDFSGFRGAGSYCLRARVHGSDICSHPFIIEEDVLEQFTLSDVLYYLKGQRCSGLFDQADHRLMLSGLPGPPLDVHGGWYDATGDYGKNLSHLSFSSFFNPQQISLTVWSLFKSYALLKDKPEKGFRQIKRRMLDEAMYGADYLVRIQARGGSFYRSVSAPGPGKLAKDRVIRPEDKGYRIRQSAEQSLSSGSAENNWRSYQSSFRSGAGMAIAALAMASTYDTSGDFSPGDYLKAAENAFEFLDSNNESMTNDGKENILDDYCALSAATELYRATGHEKYKKAADKRASNLVGRLCSWEHYQDYWRADGKDRPFFHPSDAGLPVISLLYYYPLASPGFQQQIKAVLKRSLDFELALTREVNNPFGYSRQLVQDTAGLRHSAFFFPHGSEASPWWQGENARLSSMAAAARLACRLFATQDAFRDSLEHFATDQLNWICGLNPFDACMLQGRGYNNPVYGFFGTFEYANAPGGIVNGITSGLLDEQDIDFNIPFKVSGKDYDWRWAEQWLPHASWYLFAISLKP